MKKLLIVGVLLVAVAVGLSAMSAFVFSRARAAGELRDRNLGIAKTALDESGPLQSSDPRRHELQEQAEQYLRFAEQDSDEYATQIDGARYFAAGGAVCLTGGVVLLVVRRRRRS